MNDTERIDVIMDELEKTVAMQERCARYYATDAATYDVLGGILWRK